MFIDGLGISNFRSFGSEMTRLGPFEKINLIIGQNNSGKSNIIHFLAYHYKKCLMLIKGSSNSKNQIEFSDYDNHIGNNNGLFRIELGVKIEGQLYDAILQKYKNLNDNQKRWIKQIFCSSSMDFDGKLCWFQYQGPMGKLISLGVSPDWLMKIELLTLPEVNWQDLWGVLTNQRGGSLKEHWLPQTIKALSPNDVISTPEISFIPAIREIKNIENAPLNSSGINLIAELVKYQNPYDQNQKLKFEKINLFLQKITGNLSATIEIPYDQKTILVHMDNRTLPLDSLGTGIHEVIILAATATVLDEQIVCIEEPEIHLHPLLQKKLIRYLQENTTNQYFIATHSAHLLDTPDACVMHVRHDGAKSTVECVTTPKQYSEICADLGYKASDIWQSNCVIWVEGPSDRIYINHWLKNLAPDLIEGIHYSIMFYGGRLLSHLSANEPDDEEIKDFISLIRLNRHIGIVIDSDKKSPKSSINDTKKRLQEEFEQQHGFVWITKGKEIENYLPISTLEEAVKTVHSNVIGLANPDFYNNNLLYKTSKKRKQSKEKPEQEHEPVADKVKVARKIIEKPIDWSISDLKNKVEELVAFIRRANNFQERR